MSLLTILCSASTAPGPTVLPYVPDDPAPYAMPTSAPWNAPSAAIIPTYDGSNEPTHPTVVDMVHETGRPWHGYRYWMAHTPYPASNATLENPSIVVSNNGYHWHDTEVGISNPIVPEPAGRGYNSDPDLAWNPDQNRMEMIWRAMINGEEIKIRSSTDGITWSPEKVLIKAPSGGFLSPALVRLASGVWRMFAVTSAEPRQLVYRDAPSPDGPWGEVSYPATTPGPDILGNGRMIWHLDVLPPDAAGVMRGAVVTYPGGAIHPMISHDNGDTWVYGTVPLIQPLSGRWDSGIIYRPTMTYHENGTHLRLWYPAHRPSPDTRIGFTEVPLALWP